MEVFLAVADVARILMTVVYGPVTIWPPEEEPDAVDQQTEAVRPFLNPMYNRIQ